MAFFIVIFFLSIYWYIVYHTRTLLYNREFSLLYCKLYPCYCAYLFNYYVHVLYLCISWKYP